MALEVPNTSGAAYICIKGNSLVNYRYARVQNPNNNKLRPVESSQRRRPPRRAKTEDATALEAPNASGAMSIRPNEDHSEPERLSLSGFAISRFRPFDKLGHKKLD